MVSVVAVEEPTVVDASVFSPAIDSGNPVEMEGVILLSVTPTSDVVEAVESAVSGPPGSDVVRSMSVFRAEAVVSVVGSEETPVAVADCLRAGAETVPVGEAVPGFADTVTVSPPDAAVFPEAASIDPDASVSVIPSAVAPVDADAVDGVPPVEAVVTPAVAVAVAVEVFG